MKNPPLEFYNTRIQPGESLTLALPAPELYSCARMYIPIHLVHGTEPGPSLLVCSTLHGDEINGVEIIHRLFRSKVMKKLKGTFLGVPVVNVYGLAEQSRFLPGGRDLDRYFPGNESGSLADRLAHLFTATILSKADYCLDLHSGARQWSYFPHVEGDFSDKKAESLAEAFRVPLMLDSGKGEDGSLRETARQREIPYLVFKGGEALRYDEATVRAGVRSIVNTMRLLEMIPPDDSGKKDSPPPACSRRLVELWAPSSGIHRPLRRLGKKVEKGERLAVIDDPFSPGEETRIAAPEGGIIAGVNNRQLVSEGDLLFQIAVLETGDRGASRVRDWRKRNE